MNENLIPLALRMLCCLSITVSGQLADLWVCSKHVQRKKSDLSEVDIVMSSLRDIGEEIL